ncbi:MAG: leucine-rich repeat domain-containing protein [archaeon]|nr:leucine-rich repeat domain-containing protein [archaeon]
MFCSEAKLDSVKGRRNAVFGILVLVAIMASAAFLINDEGSDAATIASGSFGEDFTWTLDDKGALVINGTGDMPDWSIDNTPWNGYKTGTRAVKSVTVNEGATSLGANSFFQFTAIESVKLPSTLLNIGESCFNGCSALANVVLPGNLLVIGNSAFFKCTSLTQIVIPDSVTAIGKNAFYQCSSITTMSLGANITEMGAACLSGLSSLSKFTGAYSRIINNYLVICNTVVVASAPKSTITNVTMPNYVSAIGDYAFEGSNAKTVTLPNSVKSIGTYAFQTCYSLETVSIPESVTSFGPYAFNGDSVLKNVNLPTGITIVSPHLFHGCKALTTIDIPEGVEIIGTAAFYQCAKLKNVTIPNTVATIESDAFRGCVALTDLTIPPSVTKLSGTAFQGFTFYAADGKTKITANVDNLAGYNFVGTTITAMVKQTIPVTLTYYVDSAVYNVQVVSMGDKIVLPPNPSVDVPFGYETYKFVKWAEYTEGMKAFEDTDFHAVFDAVPKTYTLTYDIDGFKVAYFAKYGEPVVVPPFTPYKAPVDGKEFEFVKWQCSTESIVVTGDMLFTAVFKELNTVVLTVNYIEASIWNGVVDYSVMETVDINVEKGTRLVEPRKVFAYYTDESMTQAWSVKRNINSDTTVYALASATGDAGKEVFWNLDFDTGAVLLYGDGAMYNWNTNKETPWYSYRSAIETVEIDNGSNVTTVGQNAFNGCSMLYDVYIPDSVVSIGKYAFRYDYALEHISIGNNAATVGANAFGGINMVYSNGKEATVFTSAEFVGKDRTLVCSEISGTLTPTLDWTLTFDDQTMTFIGSGAMPDFESTTTMPWYKVRGSIETVLVTENITRIGARAFYGFEALHNIDIGSDVVSIGTYAFFKCSNLEGMTVGSSIEEVEGMAFSCTFTDTRGDNFNPYPQNLANRTFVKGGDNTLLFANVWGETGEVIWYLDCITRTLSFDGDGEMENYASVTKTPWYPYRAYFDTVVLGNGITNLSDFAFYSYGTVKHIVLGDNVETLGTNSLRGLSNLESISFGDSLTTIKSNALLGISFFDASGKALKTTVANLVGHSFSGNSKEMVMTA